MAMVHTAVLFGGLLIYLFAKGEAKAIGMWMFIAALVGLMVATGPAVARLLH